MPKKKKNKKQAIEQFNDFFKKAGHVARKNPELARDYIRKARRIAMRFNLKLSREIRKKFCRKCYNFFIPSNCKTRIRHGYLVLECLNCGNTQRYKIK